jgi:hypothetical protein
LGGVVPVVVGFELDGWNVADRPVEADLVGPPHPVQRGELEIVDTAPGSLVTDALRLVQGCTRGVSFTAVVGMTADELEEVRSDRDRVRDLAGVGGMYVTDPDR